MHGASMETYPLFSFVVAPYYQNFECQMTYRSLNAIVAQSKNYPFAVNITIQLRSIRATSDNKGIYLVMF